MLSILLALSGALPQDTPPAVPAPAPPAAAGTVVSEVPPLAEGESEVVTRIRYTVTPEGRATDCTIVSSDAPEAVQASICRVFTERAKFRPKLQDGTPVASTDEKTVRFRIRDDGTPPAAPVATAPAGPAAPARKLPPGR